MWRGGRYRHTRGMMECGVCGGVRVYVERG